MYKWIEVDYWVFIYGLATAIPYRVVNTRIKVQKTRQNEACQKEEQRRA